MADNGKGDAPDKSGMWGGRFAAGPAAIMAEINASIPFDKRLWQQDIAGSRAHVAMLGATGILSAQDAAAIDAGLGRVHDEFAAGGVPVDLALEDIHMTVESRLAALIGTMGRRNSSSIIPSMASAALTGPGLDSMNKSLNTG